MFAKLKTLWGVTAIRLSIIYSLIFGLVTIGLIGFMIGATVNILQEQYRASIDMEIGGLNRVYQRGGIRQLFRTLERRSSNTKVLKMMAKTIVQSPAFLKFPMV